MITSQSLYKYSVGVDASVDGAVRTEDVAIDVDVKVDVGDTVYMKTSRKMKTPKQALTPTVV